MADGIGDLTFATPEWVSAARDALTAAAARHAEGPGDLGTFTLCEVAHNPPAFRPHQRRGVPVRRGVYPNPPVRVSRRRG